MMAVVSGFRIYTVFLHAMTASNIYITAGSLVNTFIQGRYFPLGHLLAGTCGRIEPIKNT